MWLKDQGRTLTEEQWAKVHEALSKCNLPLYAQLVFGEVRRCARCMVGIWMSMHFGKGVWFGDLAVEWERQYIVIHGFVWGRKLSIILCQSYGIGTVFGEVWSWSVKHCSPKTYVIHMTKLTWIHCYSITAINIGCQYLDIFPRKCMKLATWDYRCSCVSYP